MIALHSLFVLFALFVHFTAADEYAFTVVVPAGKVECYSHSIIDGKYESFEIDFQVIAGGELDITFSIDSPKGLRLINDKKHSDGTHRINLNMESAGHGDYTFCFDNSFSIQSEKRVFFEFFLLDSSGQFLNGFDDKMSVAADVLRTLDTHLANFQNVTTNVKNKLNSIERLQRQYAGIEISDRAAVERSYEMINFWSMLHLLVMLFSFFVQVYMVRCLFEDNSKVGRILRKGRLND